MDILGYEAGDICNREGCKGIVQEEDREPCYCRHTYPPCSACTEQRAYCEECGWNAKEEERRLYNEIATKRKEKEEKEKKRLEDSRKYYDSIPKRISALLNYNRDFM